MLYTYTCDLTNKHVATKGSATTSFGQSHKKTGTGFDR